MGQLTNQYVSQSYQGLLNLNNANTGLTSTLQTVTDGLGGTSPLQISQTQVNISGSLTINGSPVAATDTGSLMKTGSVAGDTLTFTKGDGSQFSLQVTVATGSLPAGVVSGSQQITDLGFLQTSSFNSYTSSNDSKVNSLIASTGSYATTSSLTSLSQSVATTDLGQDNRLGTLEAATSSYVTETESGSFVTNVQGGLASDQVQVTKGDGSSTTFSINNVGFATSASFAQNALSASWAPDNSNRNGLITTGSIGGNQSITGSLDVQGTISATSASFTYVNTVYETASVIYSSGSNQFGDASDDTQTLYGTVRLPNGPLSVTGSATIAGASTFGGNVLVSGSNSISLRVSSSLANGGITTITPGNVVASSGSYSSTLGKVSIINVDSTGAPTTTRYVGISANPSLIGAPSVSGVTSPSILGMNASSQPEALISFQYRGAYTDGRISILKNTDLSGSLTVTNGITGSLEGTASYATNALSSSFAQNAISSSHAINADTASYYGGSVASASYAENAGTASFAEDIFVVAKNTTGGPLTKGTVVRIAGATGDQALMVTASWEDDNNSANTLGVLSEDVVNDASGSVFTQGTLLGINTSGMTAGDMLYLSSSGQYTNVKPIAPYHEVRLGQVLRVQQNNGSMYVSIMNGYELEELHDVDIQSVQVGDVLTYVSGAYGQWVNKTVDELGYLQTSSFNTYTASMDARTGSYATTGSNNFIGNETITGSLSVRSGSVSSISNNTTLNIDSYLTNSLGGQANIIKGWGDNPNAAGPGAVQTNYTGSINITGSNNIVSLPQLRATGFGGTTGHVGYISGSDNMIMSNFAGIYLNTGSQLFPKVQNNILGQGSAIVMNFTTSSLAGGHPFITNNFIQGGSVQLNSNSGSITSFGTNIINGGAVFSTQNFTTNVRTLITQNNINNSVTLNHISSSITYQSNISTSPLTINNHVSSSGIANNSVSFANNTILGGSSNTGLNVWVSGSQNSNATRLLTDNLIGGRNAIISSSFVSSSASNLISTLMYGQNLIVSGNHSSTGGSTFLGRFNDATSLHLAQDVVFAVGTGTGTSNRRTGLYVTSGSLVGVSGSLDVKGNSTFTGSVNVIGNTTLSGSSPLQVGTSNNVGVIKTLGGSNWLYRSVDDYNTIIGNVQGLNGGFFAGSEKNMVLNGFFSPFATGSNNVIIQGAGDDFISGSGNIFIGSHNSHAGGSNNILLGATSYSSGSIFNDKFELGTNSSSRIFHKQGTNPLQIGDDTQVTGSVSISNVMNLKPLDPLPAGNIGDLAVSSSNQLYFYNGAWTLIA